MRWVGLSVALLTFMCAPSQPSRPAPTSVPPPDEAPRAASDEIVKVTPIELMDRFVEGEKTLTPTAEHASSEYGMAITAGMDLCISSDGAVVRADLIPGHNEPAYEQKVLDAVRRWRFRPKVGATECVSSIGLVFETPGTKQP